MPNRPARLVPTLAAVLAAVCAWGCDASPDDAPTTTATAAVQNAKVELFVTDWCPYCQRLEAYLQENGVQYVRNNIETDREARIEHQKLGGGGIPVTRIGDQVVRGFDPERIGPLVGIQPE
jgi:glutaredoxin